jgi:hypothetical protein
MINYLCVLNKYKYFYLILSSLFSIFILFIYKYINQYEYFWQYPVITEKDFYNKNKSNDSYMGIPWATIIDKKYNISIVKQYIKHKYQMDKEYYTLCQHINFHTIIPLFKIVNIKTLYASHKIIGEDIIDGIVIKPAPLYAVNYNDTTRNFQFLKNVDFINTNRKYLYSFVGGYQDNYLTNIRLKIFNTKHPSDSLVINTGRWHFDSIVYSDKQNGQNKELISDKAKNNTNQYNECLLNSRFSLCPSGSGPNTIRFWESLATGAIPVLLADTLDLVEHELWNDAIVRIHEKDVDTVEHVLRAIDPGVEREMRENCLKIYKYFDSQWMKFNK